MRTASWKQTREILERLADDRPHSTKDLFPDAVGDEEVTVTKVVISLRDEGYLTVRWLYEGGADRVPRGAAGIEITPDGHRWLELDKSIRRHADMLFAKEAHAINERHQQRVEALKGKFAASQTVQSGLYIRPLMTAGLERIEALAQARFASILSAFESAGLTIDDDLTDEVTNDVLRLCGTGRETLIANIGENMKQVFGVVSDSQESIAAEIERRVSGIIANIRRDADIRHDEAFLRTHRADAAKQKPNTDVVFISCGQATDSEVQLGKSIAQLVKELTPFKAYFAQNQSNLDGVKENILKALNRSFGLIAIMHPRGKVAGLAGEEHVRGSVWIEQEIAIAAFLSQVLDRKIEVIAFVHRDVYREGLREQLQLNPLRFVSNDEVLSQLRQVLPRWGNAAKGAV